MELIYFNQSRRVRRRFGAFKVFSLQRTDIARCSSPGILREQLGALLHVELRNKNGIKPDIHEACIGGWRRIGHTSSLVVAPHIVQANLGGWLGIQAAASSAVNPNVPVALQENGYLNYLRFAS